MSDPRSTLLAAVMMSTLLLGCDRPEGRTRTVARKSVEMVADTSTDTTAAASAAPAGKGIIKGKVLFGGTRPPAAEINMSAIPDCHKQHKTPVTEETIVASDKNELANVVVYLKDGASLGGAVPTTPAVLDQKGCVYHPHVLPMMAGQPFIVQNSDPFLHNVHGFAKDNGEFNFPQQSKGERKKVDANKSVENYKVKCDVHPWMGAFIVILDNPFFAATKTDGTFEITGLPAGSHTLVFWHEKLGRQEQSVTVTEEKPAEVTMTLK